jgi:hypothetical protein
VSVPTIQDFRNLLDAKVRQVLDSYDGQVSAFLTREHLADGTHPFGLWTSVPYAATRFTASGAMTWTVTNASVNTYAYTKLGKTITLAFWLNLTTVGGVVAPALELAIPDGWKVAKPMAATFGYMDNGVAGVGLVTAPRNGVKLNLYVDASTVVNWTASAALTSVYGQLTFEVQ